MIDNITYDWKLYSTSPILDNNNVALTRERYTSSLQMIHTIPYSLFIALLCLVCIEKKGIFMENKMEQNYLNNI